jgi:hypothetical protein
MKPSPTLWLVALFVVVLAAEPILRTSWMYVGLGGVVFLAVAFVADPASWQQRRVPLVLLVTYLVHQFEEHGLDALGRPYAFQASANAFLGPVLGCAPGSECPLTVDAIFWANVLLVWWPFCLALVLGRERPFLVACVAAIMVANAVAHIVPAALGLAYNPGLVTGVALFLPVGAWALWHARTHWAVADRALVLALAWAVVGHALLGGLAFLGYERGLMPTWLYPVVLGAFASLPLLAPPRAARALRSLRP